VERRASVHAQRTERVIGTVTLSSFEITSLWTTPLLVQPLDGHEAHTTRIEALAAEVPEDRLFATPDPSVEWLKGNVIHGIGAMLRALGFAQAPDIAVSCRLDRQSLGEYHSLVNRPGAYFAGLYVLRAQGETTEMGARDDGRPGCVTFYDPRVGMNMNAIDKDPYVLYHHTVALEPGMLLLWPAYVAYFVHPHLSRDPALRVAFDVKLSAGGEPA
jgi:hypothetical protein